MKKNRIDLSAPIEPGKSAAGLLLGTNIEQVDLSDFSKKIIESPSVLNPSRAYLYSSSDLTLWFKDEITLKQIGVHGNYQGKYKGLFGIGSTICQAQKELDVCCVEEIEDNLEFYEIRGMVFDIACGYPDFCHAPIKAIYVFPEADYMVDPGGYDPFCFSCLSERWKQYWSQE